MALTTEQMKAYGDAFLQNERQKKALVIDKSIKELETVSRRLAKVNEFAISDRIRGEIARLAALRLTLP